MTRRMLFVALAGVLACERDSIVSAIAPEPCAPASSVQRYAGHHVYQENCRPNGWTEVAFLKDPEPERVERFGDAVALHAGVLLASSRDEANRTWRLVRFERVAERWSYASTLTATAIGSAAESLIALDLTEDYAVAGAPEEPATGRAWVLRSGGAAEVLEPPDLGVGDTLGAAVSASGDVIAIGAPGDDGCVSPQDDGCPDAGAVHLFEVSSGRPLFLASIKSPQPMSGERFGSSVDLDGDRLIVGAPSNCDLSEIGCEGSGAAYVFLREGGAWRAEKRLSSPVGFDRQFGVTVAWANKDAIVGVPFGYHCVAEAAECPQLRSIPSHETQCAAAETSCTNSGTVHAFAPAGPAVELRERPLLRGVIWGSAIVGTEDALLIAGRGDSSCTRTWDGPMRDLSCQGAGAAHLYARDGAGWRHQRYLKAWDVSATDRYGTSIAMEGRTIVIGAPGEDSCDDRTKAACTASGAVYVYEELPQIER